MDIGLKESRVALARYYHLEPGDGTRYEFMVMRKDAENLYCAEVHGLTCQGYIYREFSVLECFAELVPGKLSFRGGKSGISELMHPYLGYITEPAHANCNPWTARAMVFAMWQFLQDEKKGSHGITE